MMGRTYGAFLMACLLSITRTQGSIIKRAAHFHQQAHLESTATVGNMEPAI